MHITTIALVMQRKDTAWLSSRLEAPVSRPCGIGHLSKYILNTSGLRCGAALTPGAGASNDEKDKRFISVLFMYF